jgi:Amt family ammonium transporter
MATVTAVATGLNIFWNLFCGTQIVLMQAGFAMIEAGTVQKKNSVGVLLKTVLSGLIAVIAYWILGYGFAFGNTKGGFIGISLFGLDGSAYDAAKDEVPQRFQFFFLQWAYAAVAVTIALSSLAERAKLQTYLIAAFFVAVWVFPIIVHWCWGEGWLSPFANQVSDYLFFGNSSNNFIDMAGSGVVHTVGGVTALVGAIALGARKVQCPISHVPSEAYSLTTHCISLCRAALTASHSDRAASLCSSWVPSWSGWLPMASIWAPHTV